MALGVASGASWAYERGPGESTAAYRPHLDGPRAVAVYLVVLFHAGVVRFSGGYIGVDVLFVLSGFLDPCIGSRYRGVPVAARLRPDRRCDRQVRPDAPHDSVRPALAPEVDTDLKSIGLIPR